MKRMNLVSLPLLVAGLIACTQPPATADLSGQSCQAYSSSGQSIGTSNTVPVTVGCNYPNQPCVAVKICVPGTTDTNDPTKCQTIDHILLDTGSYGLRLFTCAVSINLPNENVGGGQAAECVGYADGSMDWGPVMLADVYLGGETSSSGSSSTGIPIQIINANYGTIPDECLDMNGGSLPEISPTSAGFNGILGVGLSTTDCSDCSTNSQGGYVICINGNCEPSTMPTANQVVNPISMMQFNDNGTASTDNNGTVLTMGSVSPSLTNGTTGITGTLYLGVDTQADNATTSTWPHVHADVDLNMQASFTDTGVSPTYSSGTLTTSFIDSGSNLWDFPDAYIGQCSGELAGTKIYCPVSPNLHPTIIPIMTTDTGTYTVSSITIANGDNILTNGNTSFVDIGAYFSGIGGTGSFDFGFPFYYGRTVVTAFAADSTRAGWVPPFWAWSP